MNSYLCSKNAADGNPSSPGVAGITPAEDQARQLLLSLWRSRDRVHQIGTLDRNTKYFRNIPVDGISDAVSRALALSAAGVEAYFACAEYQNVYSRVAVNVSGAAAFWLDIDCGKAKAASRKGYLNVSDAETAIDKFCIDTGLPKPTHIVYTGGGLHGYWVLDRVVLRELWKLYAGKLKALTQALGLLADGSRTADIASVLRVPGTLNYKYDPPRPVVLKFAADQFIETSAMLDAIDSAYNRPCEVTGTVSNCCSYITSNATTSKSGTPDRKRLSSQPSTTGPTADHVHLLRVIMSRPDPDCGYDDWTHAGMALSFETGGSADGFAIYDAWSSTGEKYDGANATAAKWKSFQSDLKRTFTIRTLFWMAVKEGCTVEDIYAEAEPFKICGGENGRS